uniref:Uncharacterized protein n=1 Tax=Myotis myotis TaxID=51298 RepID=A0A7J7XZF4_MYOMY|nr:hypothetical protein mMyoMyo1_011332 [Myotis myotis]
MMKGCINLEFTDRYIRQDLVEASTFMYQLMTRSQHWLEFFQKADFSPHSPRHPPPTPAGATFYSIRIPGPTSAQVKAKLESHLHSENCYRTECKRQKSQVPPNLASSKGSGVPRHPGLTSPGTWSLAPMWCLPRTFLCSPPLPLLTWALYLQLHSGLRLRIRFWIC